MWCSQLYVKIDGKRCGNRTVFRADSGQQTAVSLQHGVTVGRPSYHTSTIYPLSSAAGLAKQARVSPQLILHNFIPYQVSDTSTSHRETQNEYGRIHRYVLPLYVRASTLLMLTREEETKRGEGDATEEGEHQSSLFCFISGIIHRIRGKTTKQGAFSLAPRR